MTPTKQRYSHLALACALVAVTASTAHAQTNLDPNERGPEICIPTNVRQSAPGLYGAPTWPATQFVTDAELAGTQVRSDVYEPRWGSAPRRSFVYDGRLDGHSRYRILRDAATNELLVSIQISDDLTPGATTVADKVYFGIASEPGDFAKGIVIPLIGANDPTTTEAETTHGRYVKPDWANTIGWTFAGGSWTSASVLTPPSTLNLPSWVKDVRLWNAHTDKAINGGAWAVQLRVVLDQVPIAASERPRFNFGAVVVDTNPLRAIYHAVPNTSTGCEPDPMATLPYDGHCTKRGEFFHDPAQWTRAEPLDTECAGIDIQSRDLYTTHETNNLVRILNGQANGFRIKPDFNGIEPFAEELEARLRIANWGSVADPQSGWNVIRGHGAAGCTDADPATACPDSNLILNPLDVVSSTVHPYGAYSPGGAEAILAYDCVNRTDANGDGENICELDLNTAVHQCIQVELSPAAGVPLTFQRATAWNNMYFTTASEVVEPATISVEGLERLLQNSGGRDVYLHVVPLNMPTAASEPMEDDLDALDSLRDQIEPAYDSEAYCSIETDICVPLPEGEAPGVCIYEAQDGCGEFDEEIDLGDGDFYCITTEACEPVPDGGYNPILTSMDKDQVLARSYPTVTVYPYYDSGRTELVGGQPAAVLVPMYAFGLYVTHEGEFFGWLNGITGPNVTELRPDLFLLSLANEGKQDIDIRVSAEEQPHHAPFTQIAGSATTFGLGFDVVNITGITEARALDLRTSTVTLDKVLYESTERVQSLRAPRALTRLPGATRTFAAYASSGAAPNVSMEILDLPLIGRTINMNVTRARVSRPTTCGFFGTAMLTTELRIAGGGVEQGVRGTDQWSCVPTSMFNY